MLHDDPRLPGVAASTSIEALLVADRDGAVRWVNPAFTRLFGLAAERLPGSPIFTLSADADDGHLRLAWDAALSGRPWRGDLSIARDDGTTIDVETAWTAVSLNEHETCVVISWRDAAERRALEQRLRQSSRLELVGRLASGVAHDFNNLLTAILGYSRMVLDGLRPDDRRYEDVLEVHRAGERATALTRQLLAFSRHQVVNVTRVDLNATLDGVRRLARRVLRENIAMTMELQADPLWVDADPRQLEEVLLNLVVNAGDGMRDGGTLTVRTGTTDRLVGDGPGARPGGTRYAFLDVTDTGVSTPLGSTATSAPSTPLEWAGLAVVQAIVQQSHGHMSIEHRQSGGTRYAVHLPLRPAPSAGDQEQRRADMARHRGTETILVVDDDAAVRTLVERVLRNFGYQAITADGHEQAEHIFREGGRHVDLLLTDMVMPDKSGEALARGLSAIDPALKVVFMSGYADQMPRAGVTGRTPVLLPKPFSPDTLAAIVRQVLDGHGASNA